MAVEAQGLNVRVNAISPAAVKTFVTENLIAAGSLFHHNCSKNTW